MAGRRFARGGVLGGWVWLQFAEGAQLGGAAPGVGGDLVVGRRDRAAGKKFGVFHAQVLRTVVVLALGQTGEAAEELLGDAVLERVEADRAEHAAGDEPLEGGGQRALDGAELVVDRDANALEGSRGRVDLGGEAVAGRNRLGDERGERGGAGQRAGAASGDDRAHDMAPVLLLAIVADGADEHFLGGGFEPHGGGHAGTRVHTHVGGGVVAEGETALGVVELEGGNPEVEEDAVELIHRKFTEAAEVAVDEGEPALELLAEDFGARLCGGIAVERDNVDAGSGLQNGARVAAAAEGRVEVAAAGARREQLEGFAQQNGKVSGRHGGDGGVKRHGARRRTVADADV